MYIHIYILGKNIGGANQNIGGNAGKTGMVNAWAFLNYWGMRTRAAPKVYAYTRMYTYKHTRGLVTQVRIYIAPTYFRYVS